MAEREGSEPPDPFGSTVFKTAAFDHSATSPVSICSCAGYSRRPHRCQKGITSRFSESFWP